MQLPLSALITAAVAEQDDLIGGAFTALRLEDGASELCILVLYLLCLQRLPEMEGASHAAYVRALPSGAPSPLAWPEQTLDVLRASPLAAALKKQADVLEELHRLWLPKLLARLHPPLTRHAGDSRLGKAEVLHAFSMVASRAFSISFPDGAEVLSLIPLVDMLDHSFHVKTKHTTKREERPQPRAEGGRERRQEEGGTRAEETVGLEVSGRGNEVPRKPSLVVCLGACP